MNCRYCDRNRETKYPLYARAFHGDMLYFHWLSGFNPSIVATDNDYGIIWTFQPSNCPFCGKSIKRF